MDTNEKCHLAPRVDVVSPSFASLAGDWCRDQSAILLGFIWSAYAQMQSDPPCIDTRDLERSITQLLEARVHRAMSGDEPFYIQHGPYERETMKPPPAQPPQYDLAFVLNADERAMWPLEAKVLENSKSVSNYAIDVREQFLTCRYAPFSAEGAMLGYLLSGTTAEAFRNIALKVPCELKGHFRFPSHAHRISFHRRTVPPEKSYPADFLCHHLVFEFFEVRRQRM
jgi:hypothetical protein